MAKFTVLVAAAAIFCLVAPAKAQFGLLTTAINTATNTVTNSISSAVNAGIGMGTSIITSSMGGFFTMMGATARNLFENFVYGLLATLISVVFNSLKTVLTALIEQLVAFVVYMIRFFQVDIPNMVTQILGQVAQPLTG